jgi:carbon-monoxide dehydrogenase medium subunit
MKARNFRYLRPRSLDEAFRCLADGGDEAIPIAGGQSLLAGLNMRLSAPKLLVDIGDLRELGGQAHVGAQIRLGALTRHSDLLRSELVRRELPLLTRAACHIGHIAVRNRGTLGGSLAYADPAAELPACSVALDATLVLGSLAGEREVKAADFFKGLFDTDLRPGELIIAVKFPARRPGTAIGFAELARRHGDFALAGVAMEVELKSARIGKARVAYFGCVDRAHLAGSVSAALDGMTVPIADDAAIAQAIRRDLSPDDAPGLRADTKLHLATVLTRRVLNTLNGRAAA